MPQDFRTILEGLGYILSDRGNEWRAKPLYRESDSDTALRICKKTGKWIDFARNFGGDFKKLVELSGGKFNEKDVEVPFQDIEKKVEDHFETFDKGDIDLIEPTHVYWQNRGISLDTISLFNGGVIPKKTKSSMSNRYVFPIPNNRGEVIGVSGRWLYEKINKNTPKWKHLGRVESWVYPAFLTKESILSTKTIVLVESIGDALALWDAGVKNFLVLFGLNLGRAITKSLIAADPHKIIISTNNDSENNSAGNMAAKKIHKQLVEFFDESQLNIVLPDKKDWGESAKEDIIKAFK